MNAEQRDISFCSAEEIATRQLACLREQLSYMAYASPYYRQQFAELGLAAQQLASLTDLCSLPLTSKADLAANNQPFLAVAEEQVVDICLTSGTTGEPVSLWQTEKDLQRLAVNEQQAFLAAGISRNDRVLICAALDRTFMAGLAYFLGLRNIGATSIRAGSGQPALVGELVVKQRPNVLVGVPSFFLTLARRLQQSGIETQGLGINTLICIGEPVREAGLNLSPLGRLLEEAWGGQVLGTYASTEMATAFADCPKGCGGHLQPELIWVEILDEQGQPVAAGEAGEVVVTPLGIEGTPLLRYQTGDIASLHTEPCACGRNTPRLGPILGRKAQMLKYRGTTLFPSAIGHVLHAVDGVQGYYLEVEREYDLSDRLRVVVGCSDPTLTAEHLADLLAARIRVKPEVRTCTPEEILRKTIVPEQRKPVTFFDYRHTKI